VWPVDARWRAFCPTSQAIVTNVTQRRDSSHSPSRAVDILLFLQANPFCREAEMIELKNKKKCWREKVTAEITLAHVLQFAQEMGSEISAAEVATFLNENGRAQSVWIHMMQAGERYIKSNLETREVALPAISRPGVRATMVQ
jgi:hypothetical protein